MKIREEKSSRRSSRRATLLPAGHGSGASSGAEATLVTPVVQSNRCSPAKIVRGSVERLRWTKRRDSRTRTPRSAPRSRRTAICAAPRRSTRRSRCRSAPSSPSSPTTGAASHRRCITSRRRHRSSSRRCAPTSQTHRRSVAGVRQVNLWLAIGAHERPALRLLRQPARRRPRLEAAAAAARRHFGAAAARGTARAPTTRRRAPARGGARVGRAPEGGGGAPRAERGRGGLHPEGWWHEVMSPEEATLAINWWWPAARGRRRGRRRRVCAAPLVRRTRPDGGADAAQELAGCEAVDDAVRRGTSSTSSYATSPMRFSTNRRHRACLAAILNTIR